MNRWLVLLVMVGGCSASQPIGPIGPDAQTQERALQVVWEGTYGMEPATRPVSITWWPMNGCGEEQSFAGTIEGACALDSEGSKGDIYIRWMGNISASNWSRALVIWRQFLMTGDMTRPSVESLALIDRAQIALTDL